MTPLAPHLTAFLQQRLPLERGASDNTCESYAYAFKLLLEFVSQRLKTRPSQLYLEQIDASMILSFLDYLETTRHNGANSRNTRLGAVKSFMRFVEYRVPSSLEQVRQILALPLKRTESRLVSHLTQQEMQAILDAPIPSGWFGVRDRAMLHVCFAGALRASELVGLRLSDLTMQPYASVVVHGKGRRQRCLPLWKETASALKAWLSVRGTVSTPEVFINARGEAMTRSGFQYVLRKHAAVASKACPSISGKRVSPHVLRHTSALTVLQATKDLRKVSLWLGHASMQTTEMYTRIDQTVKLEALESVVAPKLRSGRFKATDRLIASLNTAHITHRRKTVGR
ncbi:tyrosine-type recombinase/integrase [Paraburkholderia phymatum]|uniref:tyrosine-type recombinase/integrase n=1 Tax=Paraburkholderia phymatum TaxID=148447 RepID=UPI00317439C3